MLVMSVCECEFFTCLWVHRRSEQVFCVGACVCVSQHAARGPGQEARPRTQHDTASRSVLWLPQLPISLTERQDVCECRWSQNVPYLCCWPAFPQIWDSSFYLEFCKFLCIHSRHIWSASNGPVRFPLFVQVWILSSESWCGPNNRIQTRFPRRCLPTSEQNLVWFASGGVNTDLNLSQLQEMYVWLGFMSHRCWPL